MIRVLLVVLVVVLCLPIVGLAVLSAISRPPTNLGPRDGKLASCPDSPNCVSTFASDPEHAVAPLKFEGPGSDAMNRLKLALAVLPRTRVVRETDNYLHAESTSLLFRFVDDVEFLVEESQGLVHFRSASRAGRSDLGVNRARMEKVRAAFDAAKGGPPPGPRRQSRADRRGGLETET